MSFNYHTFRAIMAVSLSVTPVVASSSILAASRMAKADDITITQKGKEFSQNAITLQSGDKVVFINDDTVAHNVYASSTNGKQDLGLQKPSEKGEIVFTKPGTYRIRCAIHPKMKMTVSVE